MARPKRRKPYDPSKPVHDRRARATDLLRNAQVSPIEVGDPLEPGGTLIVMRSTRNDPLANLHARKAIDEAQYQGGRAYQNYFEIAQGQQQACDPSQPYVDQSFRHRGVSVTLSEAYKRLNQANRELGQSGSGLVYAVLIVGRSIDEICRDRGLTSQRENDYIGRRFRECLECLARCYWFAATT